MPDGLRDLVRRSIDSIRIPKAASDSTTLIAAVDAVIGQVLRSVLHDRQFQALEAAWRGLDFLVKRLPTGPKLKVFLRRLWTAGAQGRPGVGGRVGGDGHLRRDLVEQTVNTPGAEPWGLIVADYTLEATAVDLLVAGCLARMAARAGVAADRGRQPPTRRVRVAGHVARSQRLAADAAGERGQGLGRASQPGRGILLGSCHAAVPAAHALWPRKQSA